MQAKFSALPAVTAFSIAPLSIGQDFCERPLNVVIQTSHNCQNLIGVLGKGPDERAKTPYTVSPDVDFRLNKPAVRMPCHAARQSGRFEREREGGGQRH